LDALKAALDERWSYRHVNGADFGAAIAAVRKRMDAGVSRDEFGIELQKFIALGMDGHAGVSSYPLKQYDRVLFNPKHAIPTEFDPDNWLYVVPIEDVVAVFRKAE